MPHADPNSASTQRAPQGWPSTDRPLRIAILGWARLRLQALEGSGYNLSATELAAGLAMTGHSVFYLRSGMDYSLVGGPRIRDEKPWRGVRCCSLVNSRNFSPASTNFAHIANEFSCPRDDALVIRWLDSIGAEVVHVHSLEGFALSVVGAIRRTGRPVVVTPHNYWYVCPQVDLLHKERDCCMDYDGGRRCVGCLETSSPRAVRFNRAIEQGAERLFGPETAALMEVVFKAARDALKGKRKPTPEDIEQADRIKPDPETARGFDPGPPDHPGTFDHGLQVRDRDKIDELGSPPLDANERFLASRDLHLRVLDGSPYGRRRLAGVDALNHASLVIPPSEFMCRVYESMGVDRSRLRHVRLGQPHFDQINRRARRSPFYDVRPWNPAEARRPIRFGFLGTTRNNKGLGVLARAIQRLEPDVRRRCQFIIHAYGLDWGYRKMLSMYPEVSFLGGYDTVMLLAAAGEYDVGILPHIWFENSPLVMLEHLHAGKFIVASRLGGPVDWLHEPGPTDARADGGLGNALLFRAGDPDALADCLRRIVSGDVIVPSPREIHEVSVLRSYPEHVAEVESIYRELLNGEPPPPSRAERGRTPASAAP